MNTKTVILVTGPTASGKTSLSIQLAKHLGTEIISADSRQCYRELNIGVAKPSANQLEEIKHHFINSHSILDKVNAVTFSRYASDAAEKIFERYDHVVMVGGTGLYIRAFEDGLDEIPVIPDAVRQDIANGYNLNGIEWLQEQVRTNDPLYYETGEIMNPQRLQRALEVKIATGKSIRQFQTPKSGKNLSPFNMIKFAIDIPREELYLNINRRVDEMMGAGLEKEARSLLPFRQLNALQTVGYSELFDYFDGKISLNEAIAKIKQNTRNYAKRQITWFRKDKEIKWVKNLDEILAHLRESSLRS